MYIYIYIHDIGTPYPSKKSYALSLDTRADLCKLISAFAYILINLRVFSMLVSKTRIVLICVGGFLITHQWWFDSLFI
jgi:hypothetical protein